MTTIFTASQIAAASVEGRGETVASYLCGDFSRFKVALCRSRFSEPVVIVTDAEVMDELTNLPDAVFIGSVDEFASSPYADLSRSR